MDCRDGQNEDHGNDDDYLDFGDEDNGGNHLDFKTFMKQLQKENQESLQ